MTDDTSGRSPELSPEEPVPDEAAEEAAREPEPSRPDKDSVAGDEASDSDEVWEWWRDPSKDAGAREELRDIWATQGSEGVQAAHEIGAYIGEAISAHLPNPTAAAEKRGLDIRWLRLKYNVPALLIGGDSLTDRMTRSVAQNGVFGPLGYVVMGGLILFVLLYLPVGSLLGALFSEIIAAVTAGVVRGFRWAWHAPYIGYVLRVAAATVVWSFIIAVARVIGRGTIHWLTGA